jgi:hypothetical protein
MASMNTLKGMLKMQIQRLQRELERLHADGSMEHSKLIKLETQISTLNEVIDIIDTL